MNTVEIKVWQVRTGFRNKEIAGMAGVKPSTVSLVISGDRNPAAPKAQKVVQALRKLGCPEEFLGSGAQAA